MSEEIKACSRCVDLEQQVAYWKDKEAVQLPRLVSCAIIVRNGLVLLEKRAPAGIEGLDGRWDLPGGKVEAGETVIQAAEREIKEELGIEVKAVSLCAQPLPSTWVYPDRGPRHWFLVGVACEITKGEPETHDRLQWFPLESLPEGILEADRNMVEQYLSSAKGKQ